MFIHRYQMMLNCWQEDPDERPTFEALRHELKEMENQTKVKQTSTPLKRDKKEFKKKRHSSLLTLVTLVTETGRWVLWGVTDETMFRKKLEHLFLVLVH